MNSDTSAPFWVVVQRLGPASKGPKFFCGAQTRNHAQAIAKDQNDREAGTARREGRDQPAFSYYVVERAAGVADGQVKANHEAWKVKPDETEETA